MLVIRGSRTNPLATPRLIEDLKDLSVEGTLYIGYPVLASADENIFVDAMLVSERYGLIIFYFPQRGFSDEEFQNEVVDKLDNLYVAITQKLRLHKALRIGRELVFTPIVVAYLSYPLPKREDGAGQIVHKGNFKDFLDQITPFEIEYFKPLNAVLQRVSSMKPAKKRTSVTKEDSKGAVLKIIEREIANLDPWQNYAAIECPDGPQCIRGLAGSGKTIVLALKAVFLHAQNPDWNIAVTFHTRSLYQYFQYLIRKFSYDQLGDEPDWTKLRLLHSWGTRTEPGVYSEVALAYGLSPQTFGEARDMYGSRTAFGGICEGLLNQVSSLDDKPLYDALLIDEAQDFPKSFFQLVYNKAVKPPHRVVWAYDELQNLGDYAIASPEEMFGVKLVNEDDKPKQDIFLPICYRNTPWALTVAHAVGFGIYRGVGLVQLFEDSTEMVWRRLGYELLSGRVQPRGHVVLRRAKESAPQYFYDWIKPSDSVQALAFNDRNKQAEWVVESIVKDIKEDELEPSDILIIFPNPVSVVKDSTTLRELLKACGLSSHIAGVTSSKDELFVNDSVAITGIFRAKGNEAAMVYLLDAEYGAEGPELIKRRNTLFTAITRSKAWVRICGCGSNMKKLKSEIDKVVSHDYTLDFVVPTAEELDRLKKIYREFTSEDRTDIEKLSDIAERLASGDLPLELIPKKVLEKLKKQLEKP